MDKGENLLTDKELEQISTLIYMAKHYIQKREAYFYNDIRDKIEQYLEKKESE